MPRERASSLLLLTLAGCAGQPVPEVRPLQTGGSEAEISQVVESALQADSRGELADTMYAPYASVIANGRSRRMAPRFAGIIEDGEVAITSTRLENRGSIAWGGLEYRWVSARSNRAEMGQATFVLTPAQNRSGWWIVQLHSSTVR